MRFLGNESEQEEQLEQNRADLMTPAFWELNNGIGDTQETNVSNEEAYQIAQLKDGENTEEENMNAWAGCQTNRFEEIKIKELLTLSPIVKKKRAARPALQQQMTFNDNSDWKHSQVSELNIRSTTPRVKNNLPLRHLAIIKGLRLDVCSSERKKNYSQLNKQYI